MAEVRLKQSLLLHRQEINTFSISILVHHSIELRLCFQNVSNCAVVFDLAYFGSSLSFFTYHSMSSIPPLSMSACIENSHQHNNQNGNDLEEHAEFHCDRMVRLLSLNGAGVSCRVKEETLLSLGPLEFCVLSCDVQCPTSVKNETDFLTMMRSISFALTVQSAAPLNRGRESADSSLLPLLSASRREVHAAVHVSEESVVWDHYLELPGQVVLLRDKPFSSASLF